MTDRDDTDTPSGLDEAIWVIEGLMDVTDECPDGDDCEYSECPYHRAVEFLTAHGRAVWEDHD